MATVTITKVTATDTKKDGSKCVDKNGKPFWKVGIKTNEYGEMWLNNNYMLFNPTTWEGTKQELEIYDEEFNGKTDKKFKIPFKGKGGGSRGAGVSEDQYKALLRICEATNANVLRVISMVDPDRNKTSDGNDGPNF